MSRDDPVRAITFEPFLSQYTAEPRSGWDPEHLAGLGRLLDLAERRISAERSREVVIWTDKDHRELRRLLKKAAFYLASREPYFDGHGYHMAALLDVAESMALPVIEPGRNDKFADSFFKLGPWCQVAERYFGKKRHSAIRWLVEQYKGKEDEKTFLRIFGGGTADSIARRLYQKARSIGEFERVVDLSSLTGLIERLVEEAKGDLYQFTFKQAGHWPEPGLFKTVFYLVRQRRDLEALTTSEWEKEMFQRVFGAVDDEASGPYEVARKAAGYRRDLEYWSYWRARVEERRQISKSQSD